MAMTKNVIDILTIIPRVDIKAKGIVYVRSILEIEYTCNNNQIKWDFFGLTLETFGVLQKSLLPPGVYVTRMKTTTTYRIGQITL